MSYEIYSPILKQFSVFDAQFFPMHLAAEAPHVKHQFLVAARPEAAVPGWLDLARSENSHQ